MDTACTVHSDMKGTITVDESDQLSINNYAKDKGTLAKHDFIKEFRAYYHYLDETFSVTAKTRMNETLEFDVPCGEFIRLFKRLEIVCHKD